MPDHTVAGEQAGDLPGCGGEEGLLEHELDSRVSAGARGTGDCAGDGLGAVAQLHAVDAGAVAVELGVADGDLADGERLARADTRESSSC